MKISCWTVKKLKKSQKNQKKSGNRRFGRFGRFGRFWPKKGSQEAQKRGPRRGPRRVPRKGRFSLFWTWRLWLAAKVENLSVARAAKKAKKMFFVYFGNLETFFFLCKHPRDSTALICHYPSLTVVYRGQGGGPGRTPRRPQIGPFRGVPKRGLRRASEGPFLGVFLAQNGSKSALSG